MAVVKRARELAAMDPRCAEELLIELIEERLHEPWEAWLTVQMSRQPGGAPPLGIRGHKALRK